MNEVLNFEYFKRLSEYLNTIEKLEKGKWYKLQFEFQKQNDGGYYFTNTQIYKIPHIIIPGVDQLRETIDKPEEQPK
jgi:hypothetical protein